MNSWSIIILLVPANWGQVYWCLHEKPHGWLVNRENGDFARKKSMYKCWCHLLSVLRLWDAVQIKVIAQVLKSLIWDYCAGVTRTPTEKTQEYMYPHMNSSVLQHTLLSNIFTLYMLILFVAKNTVCFIQFKPFCSHFCAHSTYLLSRNEDISIFYMAHYNGWAFQALLGVDCSYSFRVSATTDYLVQNKMRPLLFRL